MNILKDFEFITSVYLCVSCIFFFNPYRLLFLTIMLMEGMYVPDYTPSLSHAHTKVKEFVHTFLSCACALTSLSRGRGIYSIELAWKACE